MILIVSAVTESSSMTTMSLSLTTSSIFIILMKVTEALSLIEHGLELCLLAAHEAPSPPSDFLFAIVGDDLWALVDAETKL